MLDRGVVKEFLDCQFEDVELEIPADISQEQLVEAFCQYVEDDYYEWLKDNFKSFFNHSSLDWQQQEIQKRLARREEVSI